MSRKLKLLHRWFETDINLSRKLKLRHRWFETDINFLPIIYWYLSKYIDCTHGFCFVICEGSVFLDGYNHNGLAFSGLGSFHPFLIFIFSVVPSSMVISSDDRLPQLYIFPLFLILLKSIRFFYRHPEHSGCHGGYGRMQPLYPIKLPCSVWR